MRRSMTFAAWGAALLGLAMASGPIRGEQPAEGKAAPATHPASAAGPPDPAIQQGTVRLIRLPEADPGLPPGPGREAVMTYCAMCHTPAYITLQPPLSREVWIAEVTKMRTTYSGPIPEEKAPEIVDYLMAVRGAAAK